MYYCRECRSIFDELIEYHEDGGCYEADYGVYDLFDSHNYYPAIDYLGCPKCGASEDCTEEAYECDCCGEIYGYDELDREEDLVNGGYRLICNKCLDY